MILTKNQGRSKRDTEGVRIRKSGYIKSDGTCCYTGELNITLSLCEVLEVTFYFSKSFSETATGRSAVKISSYCSTIAFGNDCGLLLRTKV